MPQSTPLVTYLRDLRDGRAIGVAETSFYGPLATLLNTIGATLKPKVRCIIHPKGAGAGIPDGGFYTPDQLPRSADAVAIAAQIPSRGVLEAKGTADEVERIAASPQVAKYLARYGQVLVTNYRDFLLVGRDGAGHPLQLERYRLAPSEAAFWSAAPEVLAAEHEERLAEYLKRVMLSNAPLADPKDVAWFLASYARNYTPEELAAFEAGAAALGLPAAQIRALLGERTCDVYLNGVAYWKNIPQLVWEYTIGGYHLIKKWLSYRERALLGRSLTAEQGREVGAMARRIA